MHFSWFISLHFLIARHIIATVGSNVVVTTGGDLDIKPNLWGGTFTTCRAVIVYFSDQGNTTTDIVFR